MAEHEPSYSRGMTRWLNVGDYVAYRLCGEMALDYSMASQTTMFDQRSLTLRADLLGSMGLDRDFVSLSQAQPARRSAEFAPPRLRQQASAPVCRWCSEGLTSSAAPTPPGSSMREMQPS